MDTQDSFRMSVQFSDKEVSLFKRFVQQFVVDPNLDILVKDLVDAVDNPYLLPVKIMTYNPHIAQWRSCDEFIHKAILRIQDMDPVESGRLREECIALAYPEIAFDLVHNKSHTLYFRAFSRFYDFAQFVPESKLIATLRQLVLDKREGWAWSLMDALDYLPEYNLLVEIIIPVATGPGKVPPNLCAYTERHPECLGALLFCENEAERMSIVKNRIIGFLSHMPKDRYNLEMPQERKKMALRRLLILRCNGELSFENFAKRVQMTVPFWDVCHQFWLIHAMATKRNYSDAYQLINLYQFNKRLLPPLLMAPIVTHCDSATLLEDTAIPQKKYESPAYELVTTAEEFGRMLEALRKYKQFMVAGRFRFGMLYLLQIATETNTFVVDPVERNFIGQQWQDLVRILQDSLILGNTRTKELLKCWEFQMCMFPLEDPLVVDIVAWYNYLIKGRRNQKRFPIQSKIHNVHDLHFRLTKERANDLPKFALWNERPLAQEALDYAVTMVIMIRKSYEQLKRLMKGEREKSMREFMAFVEREKIRQEKEKEQDFTLDVTWN